MMYRDIITPSLVYWIIMHVTTIVGFFELMHRLDTSQFKNHRHYTAITIYAIGIYRALYMLLSILSTGYSVFIISCVWVSCINRSLEYFIVQEYWLLSMTCSCAFMLNGYIYLTSWYSYCLDDHLVYYT